MMSGTASEDLIAHAEEQLAILKQIEGSDDLLAEYDHHSFKWITGEDDDGFVVDVRDGEITVQPTATWNADSIPRPPTVIEADADVLRAIFAGNETIVDGVWGGSVQAPVYGAQMGYTSWISRILKAVRNGQVE